MIQRGIHSNAEIDAMMRAIESVEPTTRYAFDALRIALGITEQRSEPVTRMDWIEVDNESFAGNAR